MEDQTPLGEALRPTARRRSRSPAQLPPNEIVYRGRSIDSHSIAHDSQIGLLRDSLPNLLRDAGIVDAIKNSQAEIAIVKNDQQGTIASANLMASELREVLPPTKNASTSQDARLTQTESRDSRQQQKLNEMLRRRQQQDSLTQEIASGSKTAFRNVETATAQHQDAIKMCERQVSSTAQEHDPRLDPLWGPDIDYNRLFGESREGAMTLNEQKNDREDEQAENPPCLRGGALSTPDISANKITPPPAFDWE